ncbi:MAG: hypothetical protein LBH32_12120 [Dysgonamonadaceae bacterium]|jgi:tetratricopeptide (TPR) repeat protein|nr:hypothetical protein [Dysgonamonadaceae bacterium]
MNTKMIKFLIIGVICFTNITLNAQDCEILLVPYIQNKITPLPDEARSYLATKLEQIITQNGLGAGSGTGQFYLVSKFSVLSKDIISGPPQMISEQISVTLSLIDYSGEKIIASTSFEVQAVGKNENKLYVNALRNIKPDNVKIQEFIKLGKEKMLNYYDNNYQNIIKKAQTLASMKNYEEALFYSTSIPECSKGYDAAIEASMQIYKQSIDYFCQKNLMAANSVWAASQNMEGAYKAGIYLNRIDPDAACYKDAVALYKEIKNSVKEDWKFEFKNYDERALERARIDAYREVGVAWGKGQKPSTTVIGRLN